MLKHADKKEIKFSEKELAMFFSLNALNYLGLKSGQSAYRGFQRYSNLRFADAFTNGLG
jgi:hypothetical protein